MQRTRVALSAVVMTTAAVFVAAAPVSGHFTGTVADPAGDATDPDPARDIVGATLTYDRHSGTLAGEVRLRGEPGASALVTLFAGTRTPTGCDGYPAVGFGSYNDEYGASWLRLDAAGSGPRDDAVKRERGAAQRFEIADKRLAGLRPSCLVATTTEPGNSGREYDTTGPIALTAQPELGLRLANVPRQLVAGRPRRVRVTVTNPGDAPSGAIRLRAALARGLTATPRTRTLPSIAPGRSRTVTVTVRVSRRAASATDLKLIATAGRLTARAEATLYRRAPAGGGSGGGGGDRHTPQLCNRWMPDLSGQTGGSLVLVPC